MQMQILYYCKSYKSHSGMLAMSRFFSLFILLYLVLTKLCLTDMESGRPLASSPAPFSLHMASSSASSSPAPPQKLHTKSRATPSPKVSSPITISGMYRQYRENFTLDLDVLKVRAQGYS